jgi:hypothetical protein
MWFFGSDTPMENADIVAPMAGPEGHEIQFEQVAAAAAFRIDLCHLSPVNESNSNNLKRDLRISRFELHSCDSRL